MSAGGERTEWPSDARLRELRASGVVPLSPLACVCAGSVGALLGLWLTRGRVQSLFQHLGSFGSFPVELPEPVVADFIALLIVPAVVSALVIALVGLLQSRFLLRLDLAGFRAQRLVRRKAPNLLGWMGRIVVAIGVLAAAVLAGWVSLRISWTGMLYLLNNDRVYVSSWLQGFGPLFLVPVCALLGVLGVLAWFGRRWTFLYQHRMSRQELQEEQAETEVRL